VVARTRTLPCCPTADETTHLRKGGEEGGRGEKAGGRGGALSNGRDACQPFSLSHTRIHYIHLTHTLYSGSAHAKAAVLPHCPEGEARVSPSLTPEKSAQVRTFRTHAHLFNLGMPCCPTAQRERRMSAQGTPESINAFSAVLSTEGRDIGQCWAKLKPIGPKGESRLEGGTTPGSVDLSQCRYKNCPKGETRVSPSLLHHVS